MGNKIRMTVYADGDPVGSQEFDQDVVKIGALSTSHLRLQGDGVARMHAVLERSGDLWRIIDLGSLAGCSLDGVKIDKNAPLPKTGTLGIGSFRLEYELDAAPNVQSPRPQSETHASFQAEPHHTKLFDSLLAEMEKVDPSAAESIQKYRRGEWAMWQLLSDERRRHVLRLMVQAIRDGRKGNEQFARRQVASMLNLGPEGLEAVYDLAPEEALEKAYETLVAIDTAKRGLETLQKLDLAGTIKRGVGKAKEAQAEQTAARFQAGHTALEDRLQTTVAGGITLLVAYLSRAGGEELTEEDRKKWREQYAQIEKLAKKINAEDQRGQLSVIS